MISISRQTAASSRNYWFRHIVIGAVTAGLLLISVGCSQEDPVVANATVAVEASKPEDLNIILVTIDTLRTDRLSCYGSDRVQTPNIDGFANEGVRFSNAASTVPFTLPAHSSILTGLYPPGHGVRENVGYVLDESVPTVAEVLARRGWSTAGFVSAFVLDRRWGIGRGFDHYFDDFDLESVDTPNLSSVQRSGDVTISEAVRWLDQRPQDKPFFLWLHLYDPHDPFTPPEPYLSMYPDRPYDGEVAYTDSLIGQFRRELENRGLLENSMVILTADHGEGLGDHGEASHGFFLYDTTIHVGMIIRQPGGGNAGRVIDAAVSHVDLVPTILDAVNVEAPQPVHGESLLPLMAGVSSGKDRKVYSESLYPLLHYGWAPLRAIRTESYKLIDAPRSEVFSIISDPKEEHNLAGDHPDITGQLDFQLADLRGVIESEGSAVGAGPDLDPQALAQLQALGYAAGQGGVSLDEEGDRERADPKDRIGLHQAINRAQSEMRTDEDGAREILLGALQEDPDILDAHQMLGQIAVMQDRFDEGLGYYKRALEIEPDHKNSLMGMAGCYRSLGQNEEALVGFRRFLEISGHDTRASLAVADIEFESGKLGEAATALDEALDSTEAPALIHNKLGEVRVAQGRPDDALALFLQAIEENDQFPEAFFNLAVLQEERGEIRSSIANYEKAIELAPKYHQAQFNLGKVYGKMGQVDRQQELWEASIDSNPNFILGYYYLSKLLMDRGGDLAMAEEFVRLGISKDSDETEGPLGYYILADILGRTGRRAEAIDAANQGKRIQSEMK